MYTPALPTPRTHRHAPRAETPMAFVHAVVAAYTARGRSAASALQQAQIAPEALSDASARITAAQMERLCHSAMRELDDEALGWFERRLPWGSYGLLARASSGAPTLGLALARWCRQHALLTDAIALQCTPLGASLRITLHEHRPPGGAGQLREFCHVSVLRNLLGLACWWVDARLPLQLAQFAFAAPAHASVYPLLFPGPVQFEAPLSALQLDARFLDLPLVRDEAALTQMLQRALPLQVRHYRREQRLVARVRQLLALELAQLQDAQQLAARLHLSPRSLHRQLQQEGGSLQALKDEARLARATQLLQRTERPLKQIAQACGFASEKSFSRAFRSWTGSAPAQFRRAARTGA